ncbi:MAG: aconitate hydratase [Planctomycetota bacterium]|nr:MAG: aconitate hydratase [Planctomycetota bacterium]
MSQNLTRKLIESHLLDGETSPGSEIALRIDQTLTQDATGTLVMLELEAMGVDRVQTELSAQYVDHNLIQEDFKNPDDHLFLESACRRFGVWYSRPGNGVSHPVHQERFGKPGKTLVGSDSHTPAAGAIGMLAIGAGGLEVALAMAGRPLHIQMPEVWGVELVGDLPDWVSAKDVILELLRRHDVDGAVGCVLEYFGPGLSGLSAMDRHVIANMGTELGATSSVFPSDEEVRRYLASQQREEDWTELTADRGAEYDREETIDLSELEPLIAMPSSPGNVRPVRDVEGEEIYQAYLGSSANPGYRDFAVAAEIVAGRQVHSGVSFDVNPTSRQLLLNLIRDGRLAKLIESGARLHQAGCNGCIGMGQAPASGKLSLRTVPRNFPGRSGTPDDQVCLVSPETAAASALTGRVSDPRKLDRPCPRIEEPENPVIQTDLLSPPPPEDERRSVELVKGPNIVSLPEFEELPDELALPVLLKVGDDVSTDEILPAGTRVLPYRSNIPKIAEFAFEAVDETYSRRARESKDDGGHSIVAGDNYGQGSSREHAALAPRYLGLRVVIARSFARIHWQNLVNFGVLPLTFVEPDDYDRVADDARLQLKSLRKLGEQRELHVHVLGDEGGEFSVRHNLSPRQVEMLLAGGLIPQVRSAG